MQVKLTDKVGKQFVALTKHLQKNARKQFKYLIEDFHHPSLNAKKYQVSDEVWQGRIDKSWRFYFHIIEPHHIIISVINQPK